MPKQETKRFKISDHLKRAYSKEDIGITHKEFSNPTRSKETFRNIKKNPAKEIVRLRKIEDWQELQNITVIKAYASLVSKLSSEILGTNDDQWFVKRLTSSPVVCASFIKMHNMLTDMKVPAVLYIRVHALLAKRDSRGLFVPHLATVQGYNRFAEYLSRDLVEKYVLPEDMAAAIDELSSLGGHADPLKNMLLEYEAGKQYMEQARKYSAMLDEDLLLILEMKNLPGAYLLTLDDLPRLREQGLIPDEASDKIERSKALMHKAGIQQAFMREVMSRA